MSALCAQIDPDLWFDYDEHTRRAKERQRQVAVAKAICASCPLLMACRDYGLETRQPYGIWGGLDEDDRQNVLSGVPDATRNPTPQEVKQSADLGHPGVIVIEPGEQRAA